MGRLDLRIGLVQAAPDGGYYVFSGDDRRYLLTSPAPVNDIGIAGAPGFGVGICPAADLPAGFTPLAGYLDPTSATYGNYVYTDGSIMVWVPKFYYLIGTGANGFPVNWVDVKPASAYANTAAANAAGYALHRAFIDGGAEKSGFFVDKYRVSKNALGAGFVGSSLKGGLPLSTAAAHNPMADLAASGGVNAYYKAIDCAHARDGVDGAVNPASNFFVTSRFIHAALALLSLAHGLAAHGETWCAWYDWTGAKNYPKGCNNNALRDTDDATVVYLTDGYSNCGKTGSGLPFAKTTHNGQECGVADLNGLMYEISLGMTCIAAIAAIEDMSRAAACEITWTNHGLVTGDYVQVNAITQADWVGAKDKIWAITKTGDNTFTIPFNSSGFGTAYDAGTDPGTVTKGTFYAAKEAAAMKGFTAGNTLATDHWGAVGVAALMDAFVPVFATAGGGVFAQRYGSGFNQVFSEAVNGANRLLTGLGLPAAATGLSTGGDNLFGKDYFYQYIVNDLCSISCGYWGDATNAGVWRLNWSYGRTSSYYATGWRCATYPT
jgi:hypothetical protein